MVASVYKGTHIKNGESGLPTYWIYRPVETQGGFFMGREWNQVLLLGIIELLFISALLGSVLMETVFDWFYWLLKGFVQS